MSVNANINAKVIILGCGGSGGTPLIGNAWRECDAAEPKNNRTRASIHLQLENNVAVQIDTGPDFRAQYNRENLDRADFVLYTHAHGDHVSGIDDLRYLSFIMEQKIPLFGHASTMDELQNRFNYMFENDNPLYEPRIAAQSFDKTDYERVITLRSDLSPGKEFNVMPIRQNHGGGYSLGFRFGDFTYSTDVSDLSGAALDVIKGTKTWLLDCGQYGQDQVKTHPNFERVLEWNEIIGAERVILTHLTPLADYDAMCAALPKGYEPAYDGMVLGINSKFI